MGKCWELDTQRLQKAALIIAIIDTICTSVLLILFVLGSSLMVAFEIIGKEHNATRVLDIVTDDVFGTFQKSYDTLREKKDVAEDMGVWLIVMFLTFVDFIISCIFLDGVRTRDERKCQVWFNIRIVIFVTFKLILVINLIYGTSATAALPDLLYTLYRLVGLLIGYKYLMHLRSLNPISNPAENKAKQRQSIIVRKDLPVVPILKVTDCENVPTRSSICDQVISASSSYSSLDIRPVALNNERDPSTSTTSPKTNCITLKNL